MVWYSKNLNQTTSNIRNLNGTHNLVCLPCSYTQLFMMSKIQNLNGTHNLSLSFASLVLLFMMSKIQNLNGTHNEEQFWKKNRNVVYDVKDTKFEWNSQQVASNQPLLPVVYDVKDTKFEWNSQRN